MIVHTRKLVHVCMYLQEVCMYVRLYALLMMFWSSGWCWRRKNAHLSCGDAAGSGGRRWEDHEPDEVPSGIG